MTFPFFWCLEGCRFEVEDSTDGFLSMIQVGSVDRAPEAEEKRVRSCLAALLVSAWLNQLVKDLISRLLELCSAYDTSITLYGT